MTQCQYGTFVFCTFRVTDHIIYPCPVRGGGGKGGPVKGYTFPPPSLWTDIQTENITFPNVRERGAVNMLL